jgi:hypothetical protein
MAARPSLSELELNAVILALALYNDSSEMRNDGFRHEGIYQLRTKLKKLGNKEFNTNWAIFDPDPEDNIDYLLCGKEKE